MAQWKSFCAIVILGLLIPAATAYFENCKYTYYYNSTIVRSPWYPDYYNPNDYYKQGSSCMYTFVAPLEHVYDVTCQIELDKSGNSCSSEYFYVATDGDEQLRGAETFCGNGTITRTSIFRRLTLAYISGGSFNRFQCTITARKSCDCGWSVNTKIVNGVEAATNEYPSMVALVDSQSSRQSFCGGTIINPYWIVTACHCVRQQPNPNYITAKAGDHNLQQSTETRYAVFYQISEIVEHPNYSDNPTVHDIALLRTKTAMEWSRGVGPACLSCADTNYNYQNVDVIGWGTTTFGGPVSAQLQKITVQVLPQANCQTEYNGIATITSNMLCTYDSMGKGRDSCQFDSGGPVIRRTTARQNLVAVTSFGKACGDTYAVGVNTKICSYLPWIDGVIGSGNRCIK